MKADSSRPGTDPRIGRTLAGRYSLVAPLGAGSMGTVYRALQLAVGRSVAVKIINGEKSTDSAANARFMREARANSLLASPHTVQVLDFGESETGELFLVMELLEGESLRARIARLGRFPGEVAIETALAALRSLAEAHAKGVIHRDLKPEHLFFAGVKGHKQHDEIVKVLDFGIAKFVGEEGKRLNALDTREGRILGTPRYMSPEQAQAKPLDARSDLYAVGVILYEMLTGKPPFLSDDPIVVMAQHITKKPRSPSEVCPEACIPRELEDVVVRALSKDPEARAKSAEAMAEELNAVLASGVTHLAGVRSRISSLPPPPIGATGNPGTSGAVVVPHARDSDAIPTADIEHEVESETLELARKRPGRSTAIALALALVVGGAATAVLYLRPSSAPTMGVAAQSTPAASAPLPAKAPAPPPPPAQASAAPPPRAEMSSVPVEMLPSAMPSAPPPPYRGRKPGSAKPPLATPARPTGPGSKDYDYLE